MTVGRTRWRNIGSGDDSRLIHADDPRPWRIVLATDAGRRPAGYGVAMHAVARFIGRWWSVLLAGAIGVILVLEIAFDDRRGLGIACIAACAVALGFCRWQPVAAFGGLAALAVGIVIAPDSTFEGFAGGVAAFAIAAIVGSLRPPRERFGGLVLVLGAVAALVLRLSDATIRIESGAGSRTEALVGNLTTVLIFWGVAWLVASRVRVTRSAREQVARLEAERDLAAREAVAAERGRIARELHDVVAHSVSVMTVQAGGVRRLLNDDQERERDALAAIEETGRKALTEMRRMVAVMRDDGDGASLAPQPGIEMIDELVGEMRDAGLPVELSVSSEGPELPAGIDLSVFRIVQEGLTNVLKHAGPARAWVTVRRDDGAVEVTVEDDGTNSPSGNGRGHGLLGMRERVAVYGGTLHTGPRPGGGFRVHARLPLDSEDSA